MNKSTLRIYRKRLEEKGYKSTIFKIVLKNSNLTREVELLVLKKEEDKTFLRNMGEINNPALPEYIEQTLLKHY